MQADFETGWKQRARRRQGWGGAFFALAIILFGVLLLLDRLDIFYFRDAWRWWPVLVIGIGATRIGTAFDWSGRAIGLLIAAVGALLLADSLRVLRLDAQLVWSLLIIAVGVLMLTRVLSRRVPKAEETSADAVNEFCVFGGIDKRNSSQNFLGGQATAMFGGIKLDLRKAGIKRDRVLLDTTALFGGIELLVPEEWTVVCRGTSVFGGYEDKTSHPEELGAARPELVVTGLAMFGGVEIKN
jgi:predicted membrane protein